MKISSLLMTTVAAASVASLANAETLRWARAGDALTLDPHSQNEGPTHTMRHQMYEPLIIRDTSGAFEAALATDWAPSESDPNVWVFNLRQGVKFHDGADFTAEDVVFSFERAKQPTSDMKELINSIVAEPEEGKIYRGKVVKIMDFGAFVNFFGKRDGLVHISQMTWERGSNPKDLVKEGQEVWVKLMGFDDRGKVRLSMKVVDQETGEEIKKEKSDA